MVSYTYDAWSNIIATTDDSGKNLAKLNPYRYRGYKYDEETSLYYLNSRYFNSEWGRFINADGLIGQTGDILGHNMFAYCQNNPVMMVDPSGNLPHILVGAAIGALVGGGLSAATQYFTTGSVDWTEVGAATVSGAIAGTGAGLWAVASGAAGAVAGKMITDIAADGKLNDNLVEYTEQAFVGALANGLGELGGMAGSRAMNKFLP